MVSTTRVRQYFLIGVMMCALLPSPTSAMANIDQVATPESTAPVEIEIPVIAPDDDMATAATGEMSATVEPRASPVSQQLPALAHKSVKVMSIDANNQSDNTDLGKGKDKSDAVQLASQIIPANASAIISGFEVNESGRLVALELRNMTNDFVDLSQWTISAVYLDDVNEEAPCTVQPTGYLKAKQYITMTDGNASIDVHWPKNAAAYTGDLSCSGPQGKLIAIEVIAADSHPASVVERVDVEKYSRKDVTVDTTIDTTGVWVRKSFTSTYRSGDFLNDFLIPTSKTRPLYYGQVYAPPSSAPLQITEVYVAPSQCAPNDTTTLCHRYVKVRNLARETVDLSSYRLRGGSSNSRSTTRNTTPLSGKIASGQTVIVSQSASGDDIYLGADDGSVWFEDFYGLRDYRSESSVFPYKSAGTVKNTGLSWALDVSDGAWKWSLPSPDSANNVIQLPQTGATTSKASGLVPCRADQYRSPDTNRCRLIASSANTLTPCKPGQYRSPTTNRCRSTTLAGSSLKPCRADQYRSQDTNRCRLLAAAGSSLKPCTAKQYRSAETNRCRNKVASSVPSAAFAVEKVVDSGTVFLGWWLLGGASAVALGYGAWEWRREMMTGIRKLGSLMTRQR